MAFAGGVFSSFCKEKKKKGRSSLKKGGSSEGDP